MALILESDKDADARSRFDLVCDEMGGGVCLVNWQPVPSPARVLVFRPASLTQSSADEFVDVGAVVAIGFDVEGAEVVLKDVVGHALTVMVLLLFFVLECSGKLAMVLWRCSVQRCRRVHKS